MRRGSSITMFRSPSHSLSENGERDDGALAGARRRMQQHLAAPRQRILPARGSASLIGRAGKLDRVMSALRYRRRLAASGARRASS